MAKKQGSIYRKYAFEMVSIILGVLVALTMDEWNEDRQNNERAEIAIQNVHFELEKNLKILKVLHPDNLTTLNVLQEASLPDTNLKILPGLQLHDTAWRTLESSQVTSYIEYNDLFQIAQVYSIQGIYKDIGNNFIDQIMETKSIALALGKELSEEEVVLSSIELLELMVTIEGNLIDFIQNFLDQNP